MRIHNIQYVRNGSGRCEGFTQVFFKQDRHNKNMLAIMFENPNQLAVVNLDNPTVKASGEYYLPWIREAIATWYDTFDHATGSYTQQFPFEVK